MRTTRNASTGPWVAEKHLPRFKAWCESQGYTTRDLVTATPLRTGLEIQHHGHWMALVWNNAFKRYTADRRLSLLVQSFAAQGAKT